jgi:DNA-binding transcriptional ArsR family regulator
VRERLRAGSATISELAKPFGMTLTGMTKHIRMLEEAHLVTTEKVGRVRRCVLAPSRLENNNHWLQRQRPKAALTAPSKG